MKLKEWSKKKKNNGSRSTAPLRTHVLGALLRRNALYRRRNWMAALLEIALPVVMLMAVLLLKSVAPGKNTSKNTKFYNTTIPNASEAFIPLTFGDYVTAMQANRTCYRITQGRYKGRLGITGMPNGQYDWQVPFVRCNDMQCKTVGQDAQPFCEYLILGVAAEDTASRDRALRFKNWIYQQYPILTSKDNKTLPFRFDLVRLFDSRHAMDEYIEAADYGTASKPKLALGIIWAGGNATRHYQYYLRQNATLFNVPAEQDHPAARTTPDTTRKFDSAARDDEWCELAYGAPFMGRMQLSCTGQYLYNGVLTLQNLIGKFILQDSGAWQRFPVAEAGIAFVPFPAGAYEEGGFFSNLGELVGIMICLGMLFPVASMMGSICREKELRQKELMKMMGVTEAEIGWAWFLSFLLFYGGIAASIVSVVSFQLYENSNAMTMWGFWILTFTALITYCMALSALVSNGTRGVVIGIMSTLMGAFLVMAYSFWKGQAAIIQLLSLHPVAAFSYGLQEVGRLEDAGVGVTYHTIESTDVPSGYTFWMCIRMLMLDIAIWGTLTWYLNRVIKPVYGTALPLYFPFTRTYWCGPKQEGMASDFWSNDPDAVAVSTGLRSSPIEDVSDSLRQQTRNGESIEVRGLTKQFGRKKAVDNFSLSCYKGQVTALLGHNGAGKTTTISMLTGTLLPTSGKISICGKDTRSQMSEIRKNIGICLQHDCLFPQLTVREHVEFFTQIKGVHSNMSRSDAERSIDEAIKDVALGEKSDTFSRNLSGGMKRKLSVAIAFCGGSEAVILDEPTSGMDPFSRRFTWNVIRRYRRNRCIILTTHFMDEADILGDRIAIMSEGRLCCLGSPLFLKKTYGVGYQLTIEVPSTEEGNLISNRRKLKEIVTKSVKEAALLSNVGSEISYRLPVGAASSFGPMFDKLDRAIDNRRIVSYGVGITTLEEVFLLVSRGEDKAQKKERNKSSRKRSSRCSAKIALDDDSSSRRFVRHTQALFKKRVSNFRRDKKAWLCTTLFPSAFVLAGFLSVKLIPNERDFRPIALRLEDYNIDAASPRNPIAVNSPSNPFSCQPGYCAYNESENLNWINETEESYYFCGEQARSWENEYSRCSISTPAVDIVGRIVEAGAEPVVQNVSSVLEASAQLWNSSNAYVASQYGAIYFTRDRSSIILETGENFDEKALETCTYIYEEEEADYMSLEDCESFKGLGYVISYNFTALHVSPTFQVLATQSLAREAMNTNDFHIDCVLDPLPITQQEKGFSDEDKAFNAWYLIVLGFPFVAGAFATFVVEEKESKSKHLQTVAGVSPTAYWVSTFFWDVSNYIIPMSITILLMFLFDIKMLTTAKKDVFGGVITLLILFGPASASFTYCISQLFRSPSRCNIFIILQGFFFGVGGPLAVLYLHIYAREIWKPQPKLLVAANAISWVMRFNPFFNLGKGLLYCIYIETIHLIEKGVFTVWSTDILRYEIVFLAWQGVGYLGLAILLDIWSTNPHKVEIFNWLIDILTLQLLFKNKATADATAAASPDDDDVMAEQRRVTSGEASSDLIVLNRLCKVYPNGKKAVNQLSLGIPPGQCFGLLGINGAGKTTTMQMLTAEFPPTSGDAVLASYSVRNSPEKTRRLIGYCPQFDAHFPNLTGREHVELYARIKGILSSNLKNAVAKKLEEVGLSSEDSDRLTSEYSGGMRRRLSLACAMIGQPKIVFLDEVSTGVDPVARREIWKLVSDIVRDENIPLEERTSVILTTHSMEECEALCPRIAIMANGTLSCLGSAQHLKNKFGQGFQIEIKAKLVKDTDDDYRRILVMMMQLGVSASTSIDLNEATGILKELTGDDSLASLIDGSNPSGYAIYKDATSQAGVQAVDLAAFAAFEQRMCNIAEYIRRSYSSSILRERQDTKMRFEVGSKETKISEIFASIEANKESLMLADYSVSQTSLEQVFNQHAEAAEQVKQGQGEESRRRLLWPRQKLGLFLTSKLDQTEEADSESTSVKDVSSPPHFSALKPCPVSRRQVADPTAIPLTELDPQSRISPWFREVAELPVCGASGDRKDSLPVKSQMNPLPECVEDCEAQPPPSLYSSLGNPTDCDRSRSESSTDPLPIFVKDTASSEDASSDRPWLESKTAEFLSWLEDQVAASTGKEEEATKSQSSGQARTLTKAEPQHESSDRAGTISKTDSHMGQFLAWLENQVAAYKGQAKAVPEPHSSTSKDERVATDPEDCFWDQSNPKWFADQSPIWANRQGDDLSAAGNIQDQSGNVPDSLNQPAKIAVALSEEIEIEGDHLEIDVSNVGLQATSSSRSSMAEGTWTGDGYFV